MRLPAITPILLTAVTLCADASSPLVAPEQYWIVFTAIYSFQKDALLCPSKHTCQKLSLKKKREDFVSHMQSFSTVAKAGFWNCREETVTFPQLLIAACLSTDFSALNIAWERQLLSEGTLPLHCTQAVSMHILTELSSFNAQSYWIKSEFCISALHTSPCTKISFNSVPSTTSNSCRLCAFYTPSVRGKVHGCYPPTCAQSYCQMSTMICTLQLKQKVIRFVKILRFFLEDGSCLCRTQWF